MASPQSSWSLFAACFSPLCAGCGINASPLPELPTDSGELAAAKVDGGLAPEASLSVLQVRLDPSFGLDGNLGGHLSAWTPVGVGIDAIGRILVAGPNNDSASPPAEIMHRLMPDGTLDETFGASGRATLAVSPNQWAQVVRIWADGTIGVLGAAPVDGSEGAFVARLHSDGSPDSTFGDPPPLAASRGSFSAGLWWDDGSGFLFGAQALVHFDVAGRLDPAYGPSGIRQALTGALGRNGQLWTGAGSRVSRYLASGVPDTSFGLGGSVEVAWGDLEAFHPTLAVLVADANGNALLVGSHTATGAQYVDIARLTATGAPDATFSSGRFASVETHGGPVGAAELADGRVVVWTAGGELVAFASDGSVPKVQSLAVLGTVLTATLDSAQRLVVAGMMTANPVDSEWFVRRYLLL